jgi:hypothetical protein
MNLLFLTLPAVVFVALAWLLFHNSDRIRMAFVCLLVAALSAVSALLLAAHGRQLPGDGKTIHKSPGSALRLSAVILLR